MRTATLRDATPEDIDALVAIEEAAFPTDRLSRRSFRSLVEGKTARTVVIAEGGAGAVLGYAMILFRRGTALARLYSIAVRPDAVGRGHGESLLEAAEKTAFEHDRLFLRLEVREDNARAIALYERRGYRMIGRTPDYYEDGTAALRFEKTLRGDTPLASNTPFYEQTTDFTCGPACLMMALARDGGATSHSGSATRSGRGAHAAPASDFAASPARGSTLRSTDSILTPALEIRLWRKATTVFMMSGVGGCEPFGLAVAAHEHGLKPRILVSRNGPLFLDSVRDEEKRRVMKLAQEDFRSEAARLKIPVAKRAFTLTDIRAAIEAGETAVVLVSGYLMFGTRVPHWVLAHGDDGRHIMVHDPWVDREEGETIADAANLPIPHAVFDRIARYGRPPLRAAVILKGAR